MNNPLVTTLKLRSPCVLCVSPCPQSQGHHDHSEVGKSHETDMATEFDGVWKGLTALAGIYLLFIIEHCIGMFKHYKDRKVKPNGISHQPMVYTDNVPANAQSSSYKNCFFS